MMRLPVQGLMTWAVQRGNRERPRGPADDTIVSVYIEGKRQERLS